MKHSPKVSGPNMGRRLLIRFIMWSTFAFCFGMVCFTWYRSGWFAATVIFRFWKRWELNRNHQCYKEWKQQTTLDNLSLIMQCASSRQAAPPSRGPSTRVPSTGTHPWPSATGSGKPSTCPISWWRQPRRPASRTASTNFQYGENTASSTMQGKLSRQEHTVLNMLRSLSI